MADKKISALTDGTTPATTDLFPAARSGGTTVQMAWSELKAAMPGAEIGYTQITAPVTVSSTTEASGTALISPGALTFDGAPVIVEVYSPEIIIGSATQICVVTMFESTTEIGRIGYSGGVIAGNTMFLARYRFTPSAGAHTYTITAFTTTGSAVFGAGATGTTNLVPAYCRFTKV